MSNRLNILTEAKKPFLGRTERRQAVQEKFERLWHEDPKQFDPNRSAMERERIDRTWTLIAPQVNTNTIALDIPCGWGALSIRLKEAGALVHAADIAAVPLDRLKDRVETFQECLPNTTLKEEHYDLVVSTDAIAYLNSDDYRLYMSELARLVKPQGRVVCSTALDIDSEDALERFITLAETEFELDTWMFSYHAYTIRLLNFLKAPANFIHKKGHSFWSKLNSSFPLVGFWHLINLVATPLYRQVKQSRSLLLLLERACRFFSSEAGISHVIVSGKRRPLFTPEPPEEPPRKPKQRVWE